MPADRHLRLLLRSFHSAIAASRADAAVCRHLPPPPKRGAIIVLAAGKAAAGMARAVEQFYPAETPLRGLAIAPHGADSCGLSRLRFLTGAHPLPDAAAARAARLLMREAQRATKDDLVLVLVSGGGSSVLGAPAAGLRLADIRRVIDGLLRAGADVREINIVRRHLGAAAGGRLAAMCRAPLLALLISDVVGDRPADIASGPCVADPSTCAEALAVIEKWRVFCPSAIVAGLQSGALETPSTAASAHAENIVIAGAAQALAAAAESLRRGGIRTVVNAGALSGSAESLAQMHRRRLAALAAAPSPAALISGGEAQTPGGAGCGGRNTEFALHLWRLTPPQTRVLACDTDGIDGNQDAAGALFGEVARRRAAARGMSAAAYLRRGDSGGFFDEIGALVRTGATGVNVSDYRAVIPA